MDEVSDEEESQEYGQTLSDTQTSRTTLLFSPSPSVSRELGLLHPPPNHISILCELYIENCDPMFKVLHVPSLRKFVAHACSNVHGIPSGNFIEALLFAIYYAAITSLTGEQCLQFFQDSRERLLARYRMATETALANADMLNTKELGTLQALLIFLVSIP